MSESDIAVVIPAHNAARWIGRALTSVFQQTYRPAEIIVVDDGSSDDTAVLAGEFSEVRVVSQPNQERGAARNTGVRSAHSPWVALLDADDEWLPEHLDYARRTLSID